MIEQMRGESVAQRVRGENSFYASLEQMLFNILPERLASYRAATAR